MDAHTSDETSAPNGDSVTADQGSINFDSLQSVASDNDTMLLSKMPGAILTRVELDLACFSEKLVNLNILVMHVAMRESDFEAFVADHDYHLGDSLLKALEFDLLSGVLDSEVRELDNFMSTVQSKINNIREFVSSSKHMGHSLREIEDKIHDSEESLKQSLDQVSEIKGQSAKFQRALSSCSREEKEKVNPAADFGESGDFFDLSEKVKMQTAEQQRHFLRMLEKSLARELDLEKKVTELKQMDEDIKLKLQTSKQEALFMEEEALIILQRLFQAENASEVLMGISKEKLSQLYLVQLNSNASSQHREKLRCEIKDLKEISFEAEGECKLLRDNNIKLNEELAILRARGDESEKVDLLEKQLKEYEFKMQHALAYADASEEKQGLLYGTISDMENIIEDLKSRVSRAEIQTECGEENCINLSETNSKLNEEINFLRKRLESLEGSLRKSEEIKIATAKDIGIRTKVITDLVVQLAFERKRLHQQISSLKKENKLLSHQIVKDPLGKEESKERSDVPSTSFEMEKMENNREIKLETVRNIDPRHINYKYAVMAAIALAFSVLAGVLVNQKQG